MNLHFLIHRVGEEHSTLSPRVLQSIRWDHIWEHIQMFKITVGSFHILRVHAQSIQPCPTLCDHMDCSPPGSSVHGILQARILEWVAMPSSRGIFLTLHCRQILCSWATGEAPFTFYCAWNSGPSWSDSNIALLVPPLTPQSWGLCLFLLSPSFLLQATLGFFPPCNTYTFSPVKAAHISESITHLSPACFMMFIQRKCKHPLPTSKETLLIFPSSAKIPLILWKLPHFVQTGIIPTRPSLQTSHLLHSVLIRITYKYVSVKQ